MTYKCISSPTYINNVGHSAVICVELGGRMVTRYFSDHQWQWHTVWRTGTIIRRYDSATHGWLPVKTRTDKTGNVKTTPLPKAKPISLSLAVLPVHRNVYTQLQCCITLNDLERFVQGQRSLKEKNQTHRNGGETNAVAPSFGHILNSAQNFIKTLHTFQ